MVAIETDKAGNVSAESDVYNIVIDSTAPAAPSKVDLNAADDSHGANRNVSKAGTDADDITNKQADLSFASKATGQGVHTDINGTGYDTTTYNSEHYDQSQIIFFKWVPTGAETAVIGNVDDEELTAIDAPANDRSKNIVTLTTFNVTQMGWVGRLTSIRIQIN